MDLILELIGNESILAAVATAIAGGILWVVGKTSNSVDDKLAEKVADKVKEKLNDK